MTLEYDLDDAGRGHRDRAWRSCCAALRGRKMPVSLITSGGGILDVGGHCQWERGGGIRGELVEIGGAFRIPDVMRQAAAPYTKWGPPTARTLMIIVSGE